MSTHGTRTRYVTGCRCGLCRTANREYARERDRRHARIRDAVAAGTDLDVLVDHLEARAEHVADPARRDEIVRLLAIVESVRRGRGGVTLERGPGRTRATAAERLDDLVDLLEQGVPREDAIRRCGWTQDRSALRAAHRTGHQRAAFLLQAVAA
ncbi:hypothetical protein Bra3105_17830 [Brachybacterium halotolerans subsp. kimchii]|uniref:hypothetical protein n=1 Tax=Brachybacterium halotolerans TaxID=2795215 RepID=UPI001E2F8CDE|nr:hypothetical protein [Brachybacterium halotolerans]UEJ82662.1 hypothetical protein Bra3105_17830 [Brachybacterium halotolerans subsp. kimchii]